MSWAWPEAIGVRQDDHVSGASPAEARAWFVSRSCRFAWLATWGCDVGGRSGAGWPEPEGGAGDAPGGLNACSADLLAWPGEPADGGSNTDA